MAREINAELLDTKIEKAQQDLAKAKHLYDAVAATLKGKRLNFMYDRKNPRLLSSSRSTLTIHI